MCVSASTDTTTLIGNFAGILSDMAGGGAGLEKNADGLDLGAAWHLRSTEFYLLFLLEIFMRVCTRTQTQIAVICTPKPDV